MESLNKNKNQTARQWLSMTEAALLTPYSAEYLSLLARKGKLSAKKINNAWYTTRPVVLEYMKKQAIRNKVRSLSISENLSFASSEISREALPLPKALERVEWTPVYKVPKKQGARPFIALAIAVTCIYSLGNLLPQINFENRDLALAHDALLGVVDKALDLDIEKGKYIETSAVTGSTLALQSGASQPRIIIAAANTDGIKSELLGLIRSNYEGASQILNATLEKRLNDFREEEIKRDIQTVVTSQSDSDVSRVLSPQMNSILTQGVFTNSTITNASISGSTFSGSLMDTDGIIFDNATGTNATTTNLFSTQGAFGSLNASSGSITDLLINGSTTIQYLTFGSATGTNATTTSFFSTTASSTNLFATNAIVESATSTNLYTLGQTILAGTSGNVGIGTTSPQTVEHIYTTGSTNQLRVERFGGTAGTRGKLDIWHSQIGYTGGTGADTLLSADWGMQFRVNRQSGSETPAMTITNGGLVGIGTTNPSSKFEVSSSSSSVIARITNSDSTAYNSANMLGGGRTLRISNTDAGAAWVGQEFFTRSGAFSMIGAVDNGAGTANSLVFGTGATVMERMRIDTSGNIGIGTTTPSNNLSVVGTMAQYRAVSGNTSLLQDWFSDNGGTMTLQHEFQVGGNVYHRGNVGIGTTTPLGKLDVIGGNILVGRSLDQASRYIGKSNSSGGIGLEGSANSWIGFVSSATTDILTFGTHKSGVSGGERMRIDELGNVGIGTTSPVSLLNLYDGSNNSNPTLTLSGGSGSGTSIGRIDFYSNSGSAIASSILSLRNNGNSNADLAFYTALSGSNTEKMRITKDGYVSIGSTNPKTLFFVHAGTDKNFYVSQDGTRIQFGGINDSGGSYTSTAIDGSNLVLNSNSGGDVIVGTASQFLASRLDVLAKNGDFLAGAFKNDSVTVETLGVWNGSTGDAVIAKFRTNTGTQRGSITYSSGGGVIAYNTTSDERLKNDLGVLTTSSVLNDIKIHKFAWKETGNVTTGVFAQELYRVLPNAVTVGTDEVDTNGNLKNPWSVDYSKLVPDLVLGWQSHESAINELASAVASATSSMFALLNSSTTSPSFIASVLGSIKADIVNGVTHFIELAVDNLRTKKLAVGQAGGPSGITLYDEDTGAPYCFKIKSGATLSIPGECGSAETPIYNPPIVISTTTPISDTPSAGITTTTDPVASTTPVVDITPAPPVEDTATTTDELAPPEPPVVTTETTATSTTP